jgi:hypothetical protein
VVFYRIQLETFFKKHVFLAHALGPKATFFAVISHFNGARNFVNSQEKNFKWIACGLGFAKERCCNKIKQSSFPRQQGRIQFLCP